MNAVIGIRDSSEIRQGARHVLFVEGSDDEQIDPKVLGELLRSNSLSQIEVRAMGGCDNVRSAAQALVREHPTYYFVIDRDTRTDAEVEKAWSGFPDPAQHNMLIWRRRELENYFIDPDYIEAVASALPQDIKISQAPGKTPRDKLLKFASQRVFLDAANLTLQELYEEVGSPFQAAFANPADFATESDGKSRLLSLPSFADKARHTSDLLSPASVEGIYQRYTADLTGGVFPLKYGHGSWLHRMSGKELFRQLAGPCFTVKDRTGRALQGADLHNEFAKALVRQPLQKQPDDFQKLVKVLKDRLQIAGST